jgi:tetratricopeptide (TPR) repeat protein
VRRSAILTREFAVVLSAFAWLASGAWPVRASQGVGAAPGGGQPPKSTAASSQKPAAKAGDSAEFDRLVAAATEARQAERWNDAIALYAKSVKLKPEYVEGYWYQGTAYYSLDDFSHCSEMFRKVVRLAPKNGGGYAFFGLCEFGLRDYDRSLQHLLQSSILGVGDAKELDGVARYHAAILMTRMEQYEQALERLTQFAAEGDDNPRVIEAMGIAALRMPMLPTEYPPERREMILMAGRASYMMATRNTASAEKAFEALAARYPETPNVHYAYAMCLLLEKPDKAIEEFKRELEVQPDHPASMIQIAFEYENRGDAAAALPWAQKAVAAVPKDFAARKALGQALLDSGDIDGAIKELQTGIAFAPESPGLHFTLAKAYQRAGRLEDAARERDEFTRLDKLARSRRSGTQSVGGK